MPKPSGFLRKALLRPGRSDDKERSWMVRAEELRLNFDKMQGLLPAVVQHHQTKDVLMVGFMNADAWEATQRKGLVTFWSRERQVLWTKGETSGNVLRVRRVWTDCDNDTLLVEADPAGPVCHTGNPTCFFEQVDVRQPGAVRRD
jgi:phosphoribosyl-AMP cyclohydrolase / phosphoribosyl-ATP pyrophosphohydrolase